MLKLCLLSAMILFGLMTSPVFAQDPAADTIAVITSPIPDSTITGQVVIRGSVGHPSLFLAYELEFDNLSDPNEVWLPITGRISQTVTEGTLGIWDTVGLGIADGNYQIRLRVYLNDETIPPVELIVTNLQLVNTAPTPLPSTETGLDDPQPTPGPSPTSAILQPPSVTPRPTIETLIENTGTSSTSGGENTTSLNIGRLQGAFCTGSIIALIGFGFFTSYLWLRARFRPAARQLIWQIRRELEDD